MRKALGLVVGLLLFAGLALAAVPKDTYVYMTYGDIDTLDPAQAYDTASLQIIENVYETLFTYKKDSLTEYEPLLATRYEIKDGGQTYIFHLRKGVQFHSGNPMTCRDAEYSFERILVTNPGDGPGWFFAESLIGYDSNAKSALGENASPAEYEKYWQLIDKSVECDDLYTLRFTLVKPDPTFFAKLLYAGAAIVDSKWAIEHGEWSGTKKDWLDWAGKDLRQSYLHQHVSGTGPYKLVKWDGESVVAEAFDKYWGKKPAIKKVLIQIVKEQATRIEALKRGDADRVTVNDWATLESQIRGLPGVKIWSDPNWARAAAGVIFFNFKVEGKDNPYLGKTTPRDLFGDVNVRKAFAHLVDQDALIEELFLGHGVKYTMALPPSFLGYDPTIPIYEFDPDKAEMYFKKAFGGKLWQEGFEVTITYNQGNTFRQTVAEMLKANVEEINPKFRVNVRGLQWPDYLRSARNKMLPIWPLGWVADYADPDNFIHPFYHSKGALAKRQNLNIPELDKLVEEARATVDPKKRAEIYKRIGRLAHDLAVNVPLPAQQAFIVTRDNLKGVYYNPMRSGTFLWKDISKE